MLIQAIEDPDPNVAGAGIARLHSAGVAVDVGMHADEAFRLHATGSHRVGELIRLLIELPVGECPAGERRHGRSVGRCGRVSFEECMDRLVLRVGDTRRVELRDAGLDAWKAEVQGIWPEIAPLVDAIALGRQTMKASNGAPVSAETLWCEPGEGYSYATASIHLASIMLRHVTGS